MPEGLLVIAALAKVALSGILVVLLVEFAWFSVASQVSAGCGWVFHWVLMDPSIL